VDNTWQKSPLGDSGEQAGVRVLAMLTGITVNVSPADRVRLDAVVADRNSPQKHVWRTRIGLLSAALLQE
jgi:hypothetical protein